MIVRVTAAQFKVKYQGADEDYHDLDAALLAQALLGFSEMGRTAYRTLHPEETHSLEVKVKALSPGSFEVMLEAAVPALEHLYGQVVGLFNRSDMQAASTAGGVVGLLVAAYQLVVWIGGRNFTAKSDGDETTLVTEDGDSTTIPTNVFHIYGNPTFIQTAGQTLMPLDDPHYDSLVFRDKDGNEMGKVHEDDRGYFRADPDVRESDETITIEVTVETMQIDPSTKKKWTFWSGNQKFNARMDDVGFARLVSHRKIHIGTETKLLVDRRTVVKVQPDQSIRTEHAILKVHQLTHPGEAPTHFQ